MNANMRKKSNVGHHALLLCAVGFTVMLTAQVQFIRQQNLRRQASICNHAAPGSLMFSFCDDKSSCGGELKVISMSLYGNDTRYCNGVVRNAEIVKDLMPDWQLWVYVPEYQENDPTSVPIPVTDAIAEHGGIVIPLNKTITTAAGFGMTWRFLVSDNKTVDRFVVRDADSRILLRDRYALDEWEASGLPYHVARDHPSHRLYPMSGGMWGGTNKAPTPNLLQHLSSLGSGSKSEYIHDMNFLNTLLWPLIQKSGVRQHDAFSCTKYGKNTSGFTSGWPIRRAGGEHVGAVYLRGDISRPIDLNLLPANDDASCEAPKYPKDARVPLQVGGNCSTKHCIEPLSSIYLSHYSGKNQVRMYAVRNMFIDSNSACSSFHNYVHPVIFNHTHILNWVHGQQPCTQPPSKDVLQYDERVPHPKTHFDIFPPKGIIYQRLLFVVDALFNSDTDVTIAHSLVAHVLEQAPSYARILLPDTPTINKLMKSSMQYQLRWQGCVVTDWHNAPWVALHKNGQLHWAYRIILVTLNS